MRWLKGFLVKNIENYVKIWNELIIGRSWEGNWYTLRKDIKDSRNVSTYGSLYAK